METKAKKRLIEITYEHVGTQADFDNFILALVADYIKRERLLDGERPQPNSYWENEISLL